MKTLAVLAIWLALPLAAQDMKIPTAKEFCEAAPANHINTKDDPACAKPSSSLTTEEYNDLALALLQFQSARITLLQNLAVKQAGSDDITLADKAGQAFSAHQAELAKKHGACEGAQWNFASKVWVCPSK